MGKPIYKTLVKKVLYGKGNGGLDIIVLRRKRWFGPFPFWWDWQMLNNELHRKDREIQETVKKLEKLLNDRKSIIAWLKSEAKEMDGRRETGPHPFKTDEFWFKRHRDLDPVDEASWRYMINPQILGDKNAMGTREKMGIGSPSPKKTSFIPPDLAPYKIHIEDMDNGDEFRHVMAFKDNNQQKSQEKGSRKKQPGETDEAHRARLKRMDDERKNQESDDLP